MLESLHNATKGDEYRVGGVDDDNLYPSYSNPVSAPYEPTEFQANILTGYHACFHVRLDWTSPERS